MRFRVERDAFADAVAWTARMVGSRSGVQQVLGGIRLDVTGDTLELATFDYDVSARAVLDVTGDEPGTVLLPGKLLADIARSLPARPIEITAEGTDATLTCGSATFRLRLLPLADYPALPDLPPEVGRLGSDTFLAVASAVAIAALKDDATLPYLTGVRLEMGRDTLTLAATDRYRMAKGEVAWRPAEDADPAGTSALVRAKSLVDAAKSFPGAAEVAIHRGEGVIGFSAAGRRLTNRLLDGEFPKYRSLLPTSSEATATVDRTALIDALKRVRIVADRATPVEFSFTADTVVLRAGSSDGATASESLPATYEGTEPEFNVAFNPDYVLEGLTAIESDTTCMSFTTSRKPAVLTGKAGEGDTSTSPVGTGSPDGVGEGYLYLLMPVRLPDRAAG